MDTPFSPEPSQRIVSPPASLGICSRNRATLLQETVESVLGGDTMPAEVIIIDQSDQSNTALAAFTAPEGCNLRYIWTDKVGVSAARNRAITEASHEIIVLIDDDMLVTASWLDAIVRALVDAGPDSMITGRVLPAETDRPDGFVPSTIESETPVIYQGSIDRDVLYTNNTALWRSLVDRIGCFDERMGPGTPFPAAEDNDFAFRLLDSGLRIVYAPQAVLYHRAWRAQNEIIRLYWGYGYGQGAFYAKHFRTQGRLRRRLVWDAAYNVLPFPLRWRRKGRAVFGDVAFGVAVIIGALHWTLKHGWDKL